MSVEEEIIAGLREDMETQRADFEKVNNLLDETVQDYRQRIDDLTKEGNAKIKELENKREQIRGAYTVLYNRLQKITNPNTTTTDTTTVDNKTVEVKKDTKKKAESKQTKSKSQKLTPEEIAKLQQTVEQAESKQTKPKEEDIPEYLKEEYKK